MIVQFYEEATVNRKGNGKFEFHKFLNHSKTFASLSAAVSDDEFQRFERRES